MNKLRIFIADDHIVVREGLKSLINAQPDMEVTGEADDGEAAWQAASDCLLDVMVMDVSMPKMNGAQATERLKRACPNVKVLVLTAYEDKSYLRLLLQAGASGYLLKRAAAEELIRAIRTVAAGGVYLDPALAGKVVDSFIRQPPSPDAPPRSNVLSKREAEVLRRIAEGYSNKEIAARLKISVKTVETYKARLMEKLDLRSRAEIVRYALQQGWLQKKG